MTGTLEEGSCLACSYASGYAAGEEKFGRWNRSFVRGLLHKGYGILPVLKGQMSSKDGPIMAPLPIENEEFKYAYPSWIAPIEWVKDPKLNYTLRNEDISG